MQIISPQPGSAITNDPKALKEFSILKRLLDALREKNIPNEAVLRINNEIMAVGECKKSGRKLHSCIRRVKNSVLKISTKELGLFPQNYHRKMWLALGMGIFGLPLGAAFSISLNNFGLLGLGLPVGFALGYAFGTFVDRKVQAQDKVLMLKNY